MFKYSLDNKRYHTLNYYFKNHFNSKVFKVSLNGDFNCPNIDGKVGYGGCIYCKNGSGDFAGKKSDSITIQFNNIKSMMHKKWPKAKYIAYFQANTNTYAPLKKLKEKYEEALSLDGVIGLSISTRCDCIEDDILKYLKELNKRTHLIVELGLGSIHDKSARLTNRCHDLKSFENMIIKLNSCNIKTVVHIINGIPNETKKEMIETVKYLNNLDIWGIKIHMLHILKGTGLATLYNKTNFHILTKEEYVDIVCNQLEYLNEKIVINRITGDPKIDDLIEPKWITKKFCLLNDIDKNLVENNTYQGKKLNIR
ncbi:MAG: TIGR01212 family radical SAM protein [Bacilli bacterium]